MEVVMFRRGLFFRLIGFILITVLLFAAGSALYRAGYSQGLTIGAAMASDDAELRAPWPAVPGYPYLYPYGYGLARGPSLGVFFLGGLALLFLAIFTLRPRRMWHTGKHGYPHGWKWDQHPDWPTPWQRSQQNQAKAEQDEAENSPPEGDVA
jgi:hypothetical protein